MHDPHDQPRRERVDATWLQVQQALTDSRVHVGRDHWDVADALAAIAPFLHRCDCGRITLTGHRA